MLCQAFLARSNPFRQMVVNRKDSATNEREDTSNIGKKVNKLIRHDSSRDRLDYSSRNATIARMTTITATIQNSEEVAPTVLTAAELVFGSDPLGTETLEPEAASSTADPTCPTLLRICEVKALDPPDTPEEEAPETLPLEEPILLADTLPPVYSSEPPSGIAVEEPPKIVDADM